VYSYSNLLPSNKQGPHFAMPGREEACYRVCQTSLKNFPIGLNSCQEKMTKPPSTVPSGTGKLHPAIRGPNATASMQGNAKPSKALVVTSVFSDITFNFKFYSMLRGSKGHEVTQFWYLDTIVFCLAHSGLSYSND